MVAIEEEEDNKPGPKLHNWKKQIIPINVIELFKWYKKNRPGKRPKLRGLFYHLLQQGIIKVKTRVSYNTFSSEMSYARLQSVIIPLDSLRDDVRPHVKLPDERSPEQVVKDAVEVLNNIEKYYAPYRWTEQRVWVEVWIEKDALIDDFQFAINNKGLQVVLQVNRGSEGTTALREAYLRLARLQAQSKKAVILYFGDQDADGEFMDSDLLARLKDMATMDGIKLWIASEGQDKMSQEDREKYLTELYGEAYTKHYKAGKNLTPAELRYYRDEKLNILEFSEDKFEFRRVALTDEQVTDTELKLDKLNETPKNKLSWRDLRQIDRDFVDRHGSLYEVELEGLAIKDQFEDIVADAVNEYFDFDLWEKCVQYEVDGAFPAVEIEMQMIESLYHLNEQVGIKNVSLTKIRQKVWDKRWKLQGRINAIERRYKKELHGDGYYEYYRKEWKEDDDWLARQEAKGKKIGVDLDIEEE